jgi:hypothetical protein
MVARQGEDSLILSLEVVYSAHMWKIRLETACHESQVSSMQNAMKRTEQ